MKKNVIFRIAAIVLMCTLVTACFASSTFAKYTSSASGTATATVAKWNIEVNDSGKLGVAEKTDMVFNFADTWTNVNETVANAPTVVTNLVAPGTEGSFNVKVINKSDTAAAYTIKLAYDSSSEVTLPATFAFYKDAAHTQKINLNGTTLVEAATGDLAIGSTTAQEETVTIYWAWDFNGNDTNDTTAGDNANSASLDNLVLKVAIVVDQID